MNAKGWARFSLTAHLALTALAVLTFFLRTELDYLWRSFFVCLGVWFLYLLYKNGPSASASEVPRLLRAYYWLVLFAILLASNALLYSGYSLPGVPFRLTLLGILIPFAILFRMRTR
jgi:hypothetical protein